MKLDNAEKRSRPFKSANNPNSVPNNPNSTSNKRNNLSNNPNQAPNRPTHDSSSEVKQKQERDHIPLLIIFVSVHKILHTFLILQSAD